MPDRLTPDEPSTRCVGSLSGAPCHRNGEDGLIDGTYRCPEHLAQYLVDEPLNAEIRRDGYPNYVTIRLDETTTSAIASVLDWAKATGRATYCYVTVDVSVKPVRRGCEGAGPSHGGSPMEVRLGGRDVFVCGYCRGDLERYEAQIAHVGAL